MKRRAYTDCHMPLVEITPRPNTVYVKLSINMNASDAEMRAGINDTSRVRTDTEYLFLSILLAPQISNTAMSPGISSIEHVSRNTSMA